MPSALATLLCLGLHLSQRNVAPKQILSKPIIWATPNFMVPKDKMANIWCRGPHKAIEYKLDFEGEYSALMRPDQTGKTNIVKFIRPMTSSTAGQYRCFYRTGELWSRPSDPLDLVVTGMYDTPMLSVHPGSEVMPGENVTFSCQLETATSMFFLLKEGKSSHPQSRHGNTQAEFPMGPVTTAHRGTYRCFGSYNSHIWSFPSEPVMLLVTGDAENTSLAPTEQPSSPDSWELYLLTTGTGSQKDLVLRDHTALNLLRAGLAFLVLVALVCLLVEEKLHRKKTEEGANRASCQEHRIRFRAQRPLNK